MTELAEVSDVSVQAVAALLDEPNVGLLHKLIQVIGLDRAQTLADAAQIMEAQGGMMTKKGDRRRTLGGVFFQLVRKDITKEEKRLIWPLHRGKKKRTATSQPAPAAVWEWEKILATINRSREGIGEAKTMKITLIGRPLRVANQPTYVLISMKGAAPANLPKGLPPVPAGTEITWAVMIVRTQWEKASANLETQPDDKLIIEGYPLMKDGITIVMANSCKSMLADRAAREAKTKSPTVSGRK